MPINVTKSSMAPYEEYIEEIKDLWESRWLTNKGKKHQKLESKLMEYLNVEHVSLFSNGHLALEAALASLDLNGEVITTPFTFVSTTHAIMRNGLTPVFCDINETDYTIDVNKIEELITEKTCAILPVHVYGNICDLNALQKLANKYNLKLIYDAAHAFGVEIKNKGIGEFGDISMFSFHATKVFNTIEGGALTFNNNKTLYQKLEAMKNFGMENSETIPYISGNAKMNEFQSAMGICNLKYLNEDIKKRKRVVELYQKYLSNIDGIKVWEKQENVKSNYSYFPVVFENYKYSRDEIIEKLRENNIFARKYFYPLISNLECYNEISRKGSTPVAERISQGVLTLPLYPDLNEQIVKEICEIIKM